eukprot:1159877-Pelagomonas_calceolata.AAC.18
MSIKEDASLVIIDAVKLDHNCQNREGIIRGITLGLQPGILADWALVIHTHTALNSVTKSCQNRQSRSLSAGTCKLLGLYVCKQQA